MPITLPQTLADPNTIVLKTSTIFHRIHDSKFPGTEFNPTGQRESRFSPIWNSDGSIIPVLYVAGTLEAAICETVFHDISRTHLSKQIRISMISRLSHSVISSRKNLTLVLLRNSDLRKWNVSRNELINSNSDQYKYTARWAEKINRQFPQVDGLIWTSNQCDPDDAILFFGNRVSSLDFELMETRTGDSHITFIDDIVRIGTRSNIEIVI